MLSVFKHVKAVLRRETFLLTITTAYRLARNGWIFSFSFHSDLFDLRVSPPLALYSLFTETAEFVFQAWEILVLSGDVPEDRSSLEGTVTHIVSQILHNLGTEQMMPSSVTLPTASTITEKSYEFLHSASWLLHLS